MYVELSGACWLAAVIFHSWFSPLPTDSTCLSTSPNQDHETHLIPPVSSIAQLPLNQLLHDHSLPDCRCVIHYSLALFSGQIPLYLTCLLPLTASPRLCSCTLSCLLSLDFTYARSLSVCSLPGLPHWRLLPQSELGLCWFTRLPECHRFGLLNIGNKVLNCPDLGFVLFLDLLSRYRLQGLHKIFVFGKIPSNKKNKMMQKEK